MVTLNNLNEFLSYQPELKLTNNEKDIYIIEGTYNLSSTFNGIYLQKGYNVKVIILKVYPKELPKVYITENIVPKEFEHVFSDNSLCLGSPMELCLSALENNIYDFLIKHIDSYLYSLTYFTKYNSQFPYGERSHGMLGILEFWKEYLNTDDYRVIYNVMDYISKDNYRGHSLCPCGSEQKVRNCHGNKMFPIVKNSLSDVVKTEIQLIKEELRSIEQKETTSRL